MNSAGRGLFCCPRRRWSDGLSPVDEGAVALESAQSYHEARAATLARDEMLAVVAHDLRNPLNTIHMGSSLALELVQKALTPVAA